MKSIFSIGSKQTDLEIFKYVDDKDIVNVCLINKEANGLINEEKYWLQRFFHFYKRYLEGVNYKAYKGNKSWKEYYIDITRRLKTPYPHYESALALADKRFDALYMIRNFYDIKGKGVIMRAKDSVEYYYTRTGKGNGIKEGPYVKINLPSVSEKTELNYQIISKFPTRIEENYKNGDIQSSSEIIDNIKLSESLYEDGEIKKIINWNKKGIKIYEEIYNGSRSDVTEWFVTGEIKCEKHFDEGKKDGIWYRWNKKGDKTTKYFREGKPVEYIPTAEERAADDEYIAEMEKQLELEKKMNL